MCKGKGSRLRGDFLTSTVFEIFYKCDYICSVPKLLNIEKREDLRFLKSPLSNRNRGMINTQKLKEVPCVIKKKKKPQTTESIDCKRN